MVIFRVTENINIKTTDGTLVSYVKLKNPSNLLNDTLYITTYEDFQNLKQVFTQISEKYQAKVIVEKRVRTLEYFPKELGIQNKNEFLNITNSKKLLNTKIKDYSDNLDYVSLFLDNNQVFLEDEIKNSLKQDIKLAIIGNVGFDIGEMIASCTAIRILYEELKKKFKTVKIELFLNSSDNKQFTRDRQIFSNQYFISNVSALSISVKKLFNYDYFIDTSLVTKQAYYKELNYVDAWLYKFGIDFTKITEHRKYNTLDLSKYKPSKSLVEKFEELKLKGKILLFHPYSADVKRSIPKEIASKIVKELLNKLNDYVIVSALNIDGINDDAFVSVSNYSKSFLDFAYIVSNVNNIITVDTSTYHISDIFFIPTIVLFTNENPLKRIKNYNYVKAVVVNDKSKNLSFFKFDENSLVLNRFESWQNIKIDKIIKLLD
ncbi:hypothetical protein CRV00_04055 [Malaciobacter molluscorum]|uniref:hypothetical protein n=1 Tax=Malaciobacter molluscorum TaxID=1032072 RepID=UPI00100AA9CB|nr:hypothetical protein [Malaciobacter molluscorum]RXJ95623.1 hypothetical protein CRV00_04055 [Malaciobacter molluscorum]